MRISDWSSDVFSSDLRDRRWRRRERTSQRERSKEQTFFQNVIGSARGTNIGHRFATATMGVWKASAKICRRGMMHLLDRKSVVSGKSVSVRVDRGGGRDIKTKKKM